MGCEVRTRTMIVILSEIVIVIRNKSTISMFGFVCRFGHGRHVINRGEGATKEERRREGETGRRRRGVSIRGYGTSMGYIREAVLCFVYAMGMMPVMGDMHMVVVLQCPWRGE